MFPSTGQGPKNVVQNARQAREERALQKKQEVAILKIQALVRGFLSRRKFCRSWMDDIDIIIGYKEEKPYNVSKTKHNSSNTNIVSTSKLAVDNKMTQEWQFKSFSSSTLTGTYGNLSLNQTKNIQDANPNKNETSADQATSDKINSAQTSSVKTENSENISIELAITPKVLNGTEIFNVTKQLLFIFKLERDKWRFEKLCKIILDNSNSDKNIKSSYCSLCVSKQFALPWIQQVKNLLKICCQYLVVLNPQEHHSSRLINICLNMMLLFTDASEWKISKKQPALKVILSQISNNISLDLLNHSSMQILGSLLNKKVASMQTQHNEPMLLAAFTMATRPLITSGVKDDNLVIFVKYILSVPALISNKTIPHGVSVLIKNQILHRILSLLHGEGQCIAYKMFEKRHNSSNTAIDVLCTVANLGQLAVLDKNALEGNYMQFVSLINQLLDYLVQCSCQQNASSSTTWHPVLGFFKSSENAQNQSMRFVKIQLESYWNPALLRAVFRDVLTLESLHSDDVTPTQAEQLATKVVQKAKLSDRVSSYLKKFSMSKSRVAYKPTGGRKLEYAEVKNTMSTCLMLRKLLSVITKQLQLEMLTGLTFMDEVLCRLWRFICELGSSGGLKLFLSALTLPPDVAEPYFAVFTLFCDMTAHILSILDDIEFYEEQIPFHLEELVTISESLKTFVFRIIWEHKLSNPDHQMYGVFESALTLLLMLYDRDARRPFTPIGHWICRDVKMSTIWSEIEKSSTRGLTVIDKIPFVIPHKDRVVLFRSFVATEKNAYYDEIPSHITVHRSRLLEDGFEQLSAMQNIMLKGTIRVKFINDLGLDEAGIDQDGVFKEFLEEIIKKVFNPDMNLFRITTEEDGKLYPSPSSYLQDDHLRLFNFVGRMLGKAVYEGIVVDVPFATFFLRHLQQQHSLLYSPLDELPSLDAEFYKNLTWIKRYEGDISDLDLTFTYEEDVMGRLETRELEPGGAAIPVTNQNRITYIHKLAHYRLHTQIKEQTRAFIAGFRSIVNKQWTSMFSAPELQRLISGDNVDLDLSDLKKNVTYYGGFHSSHRVVKWLWDILEKDYTPQQRSAFLKFVTSCSRPPILGFTHLQPTFSIRCVEVSDDDDTGDSVGTVLRGFFRISTKKQSGQKHRLPTASTCFNLLKLPNYPSKDILRDKLKQAIANNTGFELS
ncbi:ubiquitin-protein ligase E3B-like [Styela clava]